MKLKPEMKEESSHVSSQASRVQSSGDSHAKSACRLLERPLWGEQRGGEGRGGERGFTSPKGQSKEALGGFLAGKRPYLINMSRYYSGSLVKGEWLYRNVSGGQ